LVLALRLLPIANGVGGEFFHYLDDFEDREGHIFRILH